MQCQPSEYSILLLGVEDAADLAALEAACFPTPWTEEQYRKILQNTCPAAPVLQAVSGQQDAAAQDPATQATPVFGMRNAQGMLVAYLSLGVAHSARELEVYNIAVHADFRKRGLAGRLLAHALQKAADCGIERAFLEVRPSNGPALALYSSRGFAICGCRKKYYADTGEDALVLACELSAEPGMPLFSMNVNR